MVSGMGFSRISRFDPPDDTNHHLLSEVSFSLSVSMVTHQRLCALADADSLAGTGMRLRAVFTLDNIASGCWEKKGTKLNQAPAGSD